MGSYRAILFELHETGGSVGMQHGEPQLVLALEARPNRCAVTLFDRGSIRCVGLYKHDTHIPPAAW